MIIGLRMPQEIWNKMTSKLPVSFEKCLYCIVKRNIRKHVIVSVLSHKLKRHRCHLEKWNII